MLTYSHVISNRYNTSVFVHVCLNIYVQVIFSLIFKILLFEGKTEHLLIYTIIFPALSHEDIWQNRVSWIQIKWMYHLSGISVDKYLLIWKPSAKTTRDNCDAPPPSAPTLHQLLRTISLYGRWSTTDSDKGYRTFLYRYKKYTRGSGRKKKEQTNNMLGVKSSAEGKLCNIVRM